MLLDMLGQAATAGTHFTLFGGMDALSFFQPGSNPNPNGLGAMATFLTPLFDAARSYHRVFVGAGMILLALALVMELITMFYTFLIGGGYEKLITGLIWLFIFLTIPFAALKFPDFLGYLVDTFTQYLPKAMGVDIVGNGSQATQVVSDAFNSIVNILFSIVAGASGFVDTLVAGIVAIVLFVPTVIFGLALIVSIYGPLLMLHIGLILAPLSLPWLVWSPLRSIGVQWFTYMLHKGFAFLIGILLAQLVVTALAAYAQSINVDGNPSLTMLVMLLPLVMTIAFLTWVVFRVETIATAFVGNLGIGQPRLAARGMGRGWGGKKGDSGGGSGSKGGGSNSPSGGGKPSSNPADGPKGGGSRGTSIKPT